MSDPSLSRGDGWVLCCVCFTIHREPYPDLAVDADGQRWNVCRGACAVETGLQPDTPVTHWATRQKEPSMTDESPEPAADTFVRVPDEVHARRFTIDTGPDVIAWVRDHDGEVFAERVNSADINGLRLVTANGEVLVREGDWVYRDANGAHHRADAETFARTHVAGPLEDWVDESVRDLRAYGLAAFFRTAKEDES